MYIVTITQCNLALHGHTLQPTPQYSPNISNSLLHLWSLHVPYLQDSTGRPDEDVATETLISHMKSNNSFIQNLFQGQFRSAIICPSCTTRSCTFDPYVCVSLPLPQRECRPIYVTVVFRSSSRKSKVFGVNVSINALVRNLRNRLAEMCGIHRYMYIIYEYCNND